jgi:hypothetical protein
LSINKIHAAVLAASAACALATAASADVVVMKNGDRITGAIVSADGGKLVVTPDLDKSSKLSLSMADVATFSTTGPVALKLKDGSVINQPVAQGAPGEVVPAAVAGPVQLADVTMINPPPPPTPKWTGSLGVNGMYAHASTSTATAGIAVAATRTSTDDRIILGAAYNYGVQKADGLSTTNANNWFLSAEYDRFFSKQLFGYVSERTEADRVNFLTLRLTPGAGVGYQWINQSDFHVSAQAGVAWLYEDYRTNPAATERVAAHLGYHIDKSWDGGRLTAFHDLTVLPAFSGGEVLVQGDAGLRMQLTKRMFSQLTVNATYDNQPAPGATDLTTQFLVGVGASF